MSSEPAVTIPMLQQMKRDRRKSVGIVAWDFQTAQIADRAGVDFLVVGDSVGVNLWGHSSPLEVTLDEILICCRAVRRGAKVDLLALLAAPATWVSYATDAQSAVERITMEAGMPLAPEVLESPQAWADEFDDVETELSIAEVRVPTLIVHGSADDVVPVDHAHRIAANASDAEVRILDGAGHQLRKEPKAVEAVLEWLTGRVG